MKLKLLLPVMLMAILSSSCIKESIPISSGNLLLGRWQNKTRDFEISNVTGVSDPYTVTLVGDSLKISWPPVVNLRYKLISVDKKILKVTEKDSLIVYKRIDFE